MGRSIDSGKREEKDMNTPTIKIWEMDYSFIIKNYLNPALWDKTWTLFAYKDFVVTIRLNSIDTCKKRVLFCIELKDHSNEDTYSNSCKTYVGYCVDVEEIQFLIKGINGSVFHLINTYERNVVIEKSPSYESVKRFKETEKTRLLEIADSFLDQNGVNNEEIREVYCNNYISNNSKADDYVWEFKNNSEYHYLTDFYLVFTQSVKDENRYKNVLDALKNDEREKVLKEIDELQTYIETDTYEEEMKEELEQL